jgi:GTP-binding protein
VFIDEIEIEVKGGTGGDGAVAFRRERYVPRGGPSGGHGGRGGDVILVVDEGLNTLNAFRYDSRFVAVRGGHGGGANKHGADGESVWVRVPPGTLVEAVDSGELLADLTERGQEWVCAHGGRGGRGNSAFATTRRQAPRFAEKGEPGEERRLRLSLKLIADVGLVGLPNAGKSTLLRAVSRARPKVADYPFTTLTPVLGVAEVDDSTIVVADIPGLIEGAHQGAGLGDRFLRHIERTRMLIHVLDASASRPLQDFEAVNRELELFSPALARKTQLVACNKMDLAEARQAWPDLRAALTERGYDAMAISAATREGVAALLQAVGDTLGQLPPSPEPVALPVLRPRLEDGDAFRLDRLEDGSLRVTSRRLERVAAMTDWSNDAAVARFQRILSAAGVTQALERLGIEAGDTVRLGDVELEWQPDDRAVMHG